MPVTGQIIAKTLPQPTMHQGQCAEMRPSETSETWPLAGATDSSNKDGEKEDEEDEQDTTKVEDELTALRQLEGKPPKRKRGRKPGTADSNKKTRKA